MLWSKQLENKAAKTRDLPLGLALIKLVNVVVVVVVVEVAVVDCVDVKDANADGGSGSVGKAGSPFLNNIYYYLDLTPDYHVLC